jgi:hypothetical protein
MADRNWDQEMKKIDKHLASISDDALLQGKPTASAPGTPPAKGKVKNAATARATTSVGVFLRVALAVALGVGIVFWPYAARCGIGLMAYLAAVTAVIGGGVWSAFWTWRHRSARGHLLSLLLILWGMVLGAAEVLPRAGYAKPDAAHPAQWSCP